MNAIRYFMFILAKRSLILAKLLAGILIIVAFFLKPGIVVADEEKFLLYGHVLDENMEGLPGARIHVHETGHTVFTDSAGHYEIHGLSRGTYHIHAYMKGYRSTAQTISLRSRFTLVTFHMRPSVLEIGEVLIEAHPYKLEEREKSQEVIVLDRSTLEKNRHTSFAETIESVPGVRSVTTGPGIARPMLRGLSFHRIAVVDRGIKQEGQQWGADHGLEIDPYDVERVEIIKGPNTILYGSDASGGVINIRTPGFPDKGIIRGRIESRAESNHDLIGGSAMVEGNYEDNFFRFRYTQQEYGNYRVPSDSVTFSGWNFPIHENRLKNTAGQEMAFSGTAGMHRSWGHTQVSFSQFNQSAGLFPGAMNRHPGAFNPRHETSHRTISLPRQVTSHTKLISNSKILLRDNWLEADIGYQLNHRREEAEPHVHNPNEYLPEGIDHLILNLHTLSANVRYHHIFSDKTRGIFGTSVSAHQNEAGGYEFLIPEHRGMDAGIFAFLHQYLSDNLIINGGLRLDYGILESQRYDQIKRDATGEITDTIMRAPQINRNFYNLSGTAGMTWHPNDQASIRANLARHFRVPRAPELAANGFHHGTFRHEQGDPDLNSETGYQLDLSARYQNANILISLSPFINYYENFIYLTPTYRFSPLPSRGQVYQYEQNSVLMTGGEVFIEYHPIPPLHLELGADYVWSQNLDQNIPLPFTPQPSVFNEIAYHLPLETRVVKSPFVNVNARLFANQNRVARNEKATEGATILNAATGTSLKFSDRLDMNVQFQVRNIMNTEYQNHLSTYRILNLSEPGRNYTLYLSINL
jgi:iron complex outermembrane recepter protein